LWPEQRRLGISITTAMLEEHAHGRQCVPPHGGDGLPPGFVTEPGRSPSGRSARRGAISRQLGRVRSDALRPAGAPAARPVDAS
jgi:hypothetical protein